MEAIELKHFVKARRKSLKLTQQEMAEKAGVGLRLFGNSKGENPRYKRTK